jgi:PTS system mannose-specific IIB component/fructoselysine and glucoselysine-specific PTS system IIB component
MPILLYRVDERLIHGQVLVGWGSRLRPDRYLVVDDPLAASDWEQELYTLGLPQRSEVAFFTVTEARKQLPGWKTSDVRSILLTRDIATMLRLAEGGLLAEEEVNLGGLHLREDRQEVLPYLFLDNADRAALRALDEEGARISARDLPGSTKVPLASLLR